MGYGCFWSSRVRYIFCARAARATSAPRRCRAPSSASSKRRDRVLLERDRRSVRLTAEGGRFAEHARDTLERWQRLQRDLRGRAGQAVGQHRDLRVGHRLPELPPRAAGRLPRALPRRPHPARDRLRGRRARTAGRRARRRQRRGDSAAASARAGVARAAVHAARVRGAARGVRGRAAVPPAAAAVGRRCRSCCPRRATRATAPIAGSGAGASCRRSTARSPAARRSSRWSAWAAASASCRAWCVDESPLRGKLSVLDADDGGAALGEFRVGVCTQRKKLASPLVRALWDSFAAVEIDDLKRPGPGHTRTGTRCGCVCARRSCRRRCRRCAVPAGCSKRDLTIGSGHDRHRRGRRSAGGGATRCGPADASDGGPPPTDAGGPPPPTDAGRIGLRQRRLSAALDASRRRRSPAWTSPRPPTPSR